MWSFQDPEPIQEDPYPEDPDDGYVSDDDLEEAEEDVIEERQDSHGNQDVAGAAPASE